MDQNSFLEELEDVSNKTNKLDITDHCVEKANCIELAYKSVTTYIHIHREAWQFIHLILFAKEI